jgi:hypothetical protein
LSCKFFLIPGFAIDLKASVFKERLGPEAGFTALSDRISSGSAYVFRWGNSTELTFWQSLNPLNYRSVYEAERELALSRQTQHKLETKLDQLNPEIVLTHSMGSLLLANYLNDQGPLPPTIRKILFIQSDLDSKLQIRNNDIDERVSHGQLELVNIFCPWDITLWLSALYNLYIPSGLKKRKAQQFRNKHFPLYKRINLHMSSISDPDILKLTK